MKTYIFKVTIEKDFFEDGREAYHAYAPALKGAATWGYSKEEAIDNIKEVIQMIVESKIEHHELFEFDRQRGSHHHYYHPDSRRVTISFHSPAETFPPKTLKRIIEEQAEWTEADLRRLKLLK
ncbi:MAG: type II toxin-antitoxin system HicA family toxin [Euryarchaeota archaeon]|nr:type II toxin-antitoxin system HicA family toxin [Euryarchaeota archaeon]